MKAIHYLSIALLLLSYNNINAQNAYPDLNLEANTILENEMATDIRYYYYPNLQAYFDTQTLTYLYSKDNEWVESTRIPVGHMGYSIYNGNKIAISNYLGDAPYELIDDHKKQYPPQYIAKRKAPTKQPTAGNSAIAYN